jgi:hypothetical protein
MGASASHVSNSKISDTSHQDVSGGIYLTGWVLTIARLIWVTLSLIVTGLVIWSLSVRTFSEVELPIYFLMPLGYFAISLIIFWRKSDDLVGLLTSLMLIFFGPYLISGVNIWVSEQPGWEIFGAVMVGIGATLVIFFLFLFPDGRFVPGWTRWFTLIASILIIISSFITIWPNFSAIAILPVAAVGLLIQVYRYWRVSNPLQRQQTKWVLIGLTGPLFGIFLWLILGQPESNAFPGIQLLGIIIPIPFVFSLLTLLLPLTLAFSILRYRLWDIDFLIRRTLVYTVLTALLLILYFGSVVLLQQAFRVLTGQDSPIVIVISTLVIAALFSPLRRRVQNTIDRRFYRHKYDTQQALAAFAATARDEVDLERLQMELISIVQETMQPEQVSLWLRQQSDHSTTRWKKDKS